MYSIAIAKAAKSVDVDFDNLPEVSQKYFLEYGMRQALNDATASLKRSECSSQTDFNAKALAMVQKRLDGILKGELRQTTGRIADPLEAEVMRLAVSTISNALLSKGEKLADYTTKDLRERAVQLLERGENRQKFQAKAEQILAIKAAEMNIDVEV